MDSTRTMWVDSSRNWSGIPGLWHMPLWYVTHLTHHKSCDITITQYTSEWHNTHHTSEWHNTAHPMSHDVLCDMWHHNDAIHISVTQYPSHIIGTPYVTCHTSYIMWHHNDTIHISVTQYPSHICDTLHIMWQYISHIWQTVTQYASHITVTPCTS
jgi:hypothetical protein